MCRYLAGKDATALAPGGPPLVVTVREEAPGVNQESELDFAEAASETFSFPLKLGFGGWYT